MKLKANAKKIAVLEAKLMVQPLNTIWQNHLTRMLKQREKSLFMANILGKMHRGKHGYHKVTGIQDSSICI